MAPESSLVPQQGLNDSIDLIWVRSKFNSSQFPLLSTATGQSISDQDLHVACNACLNLLDFLNVTSLMTFSFDASAFSAVD